MKRPKSMTRIPSSGPGIISFLSGHLLLLSEALHPIAGKPLIST
jgi:hypothetical protein